MSRLAFVSPLPPSPTGIADYAADVLALLAPRHEIDVFHDQATVTGVPAGCGVYPAATLVERHRARPYDLAIHQLGNATAHAFVYPLLAAVPGLLVLHDLVLHHSRAEMLIGPAARAYAADPGSGLLRDAARAAERAYLAEAAFAYPQAASRLVAAHLGTIGDLLPYAYPLFQAPVAASRVTAVHNAAMASAIGEEMPSARVVEVAMPAQRAAVAPGAVADLRRALGIGGGDLVVGCFGLVTPEKRIVTVARAVARASVDIPALRLMVVGPVRDRAALDGMLEATGARARTMVTGRVPLESLAAHIEAADVVVHLRYPTARETSAALLRVLAQGRPTVMSDLENFAAVPADAVVRADVADEEGEVTRAILRLAADPVLRARIGARAAAYVAEAHGAARVIASYERAIQAAMAAPAPRAALPAHYSTR